MPAWNIGEKIVLVNVAIEPRYQASASDTRKLEICRRQAVIFAVSNRETTRQPTTIAQSIGR
jgi:hypothetical protein